MFAPRAEHALSGAGWEASGSESVKARELVEQHFAGLGSYGLMVVVHAPAKTIDDPAFASAVANVERTLAADESIADRRRPAAGRLDLAATGTRPWSRPAPPPIRTTWSARPTHLKGRLSALGGDGVEVSLTGAPGMWSDFNEANKAAMLKSEVVSWPVTLAILVLAFGSLVAAGLPLMLTILGLVAAAGSLYLGAQVMDISIWAMNFALMFALALGVDYALFVVYRFRGAFFGSKLSAVEATAVTMDTAGKAVLFSGLTVLISLSAVMLVPSPAFRSMSLGIMLAVAFVLAATLTLLPAVLAKLGPRVDALALKWVHSGEHRSARFARWGERLWRRPWPYALAAVAALVALTLPVFSLDTGMPSIKVVPEADGSRRGYEQVQQAFGPGATGSAAARRAARATPRG